MRARVTGCRCRSTPSRCSVAPGRPVLVTVPGHEPFRTTIASYGGQGWIGLRKAQREDLMVGEGDEITMTVEFDDVPRVAEVPPELAAALASNPDAAQAFEGLSFSHSREYAEWVGEAKRPATRERRAALAVERILRAGLARRRSRRGRRQDRRHHRFRPVSASSSVRSSVHPGTGIGGA